jgi:hypothetical protein
MPRTEDDGWRLNTPSAAYADDVGILTNTLSDLQVQAHKLSSYSDWGAMQRGQNNRVRGITQTDTRAWRHNTQVSIQPGRTAADWPHQSSGTSHIPRPQRAIHSTWGGADHDSIWPQQRAIAEKPAKT